MAYERKHARQDSTEELVQPTAGRPGAALFRMRGPIRWYILVTILYALFALGVAAYSLTLFPAGSLAIRVLPSGGLPVDQFYSGLLLSIFLTPAAIVVRNMTNELAMLHPFAITATKPTTAEDIDLIVQGGITSVRRLFRYSKFRAFVQGLSIIIGAVLVPVGTLLIVPGEFSPPVQGIAPVAMPLARGSRALMALSSDMATFDDPNGGHSGVNNSYSEVPESSFLVTLREVWAGNLNAGNKGSTLPQLGPISTFNLTYEEGVQYNGIVMYRWTSGCRYVEDDEIRVTLNQSRPDPSSDEMSFDVNITRANNLTTIGVGPGRATFIELPTSGSQLVNNLTLYYAILAPNSVTTNLAEARQAGAIKEEQNVWISRVACTPTFDWAVSNCVYQNGTMTNCQDAPGTQPSTLDVEGLDGLRRFMSSIPDSINRGDNVDHSFLGQEALVAFLTFSANAPTQKAVGQGVDQGVEISTEHFRVPLLTDFDQLYGSFAEAIAKASLNGYYGVAEVPTSGLTPQPVYLVRTYILALLLVMLFLAPALNTFVLVASMRRHVPLRRATFLTLAAAVRAPMWSDFLAGAGAMSDAELRAMCRHAPVLFGENLDMPGHLGFAPVVNPVRHDRQYW